MAHKLRGRAGEYSPILGVSYVRAIAAVLSIGVFFTISDFVTSFIALGRGFREGNALLTDLSTIMNMNVVDSLIVTKLVFIGGLSALALVGVKSDQRVTKRLMFASATVFMVVFALVSLNNLFWIAS